MGTAPPASDVCEREGRSRLARLGPALLGLAGLVAAVLPVLDPDVQLFYRDTGRLYYPLRWTITQRLLGGELPLWDPWSEAGVSLFAQLTPAIFHPGTLLYLVLPFDLAFKLHHLLALPVAGVGLFLLARRLGAGPWAALTGAFAYASCGFVISMVASNLPYAWGAATMPLAIDAFLALLDRPTAGRLLWASAALGLCGVAGDAQAMELTGLVGTAWALARPLAGVGPDALQPRLRGAVRGGLFAALWGAVALAIAAPALFPAAARLPSSTRVKGSTDTERLHFSSPPARLAGLLVPRAFDDLAEEVASTKGSSVTPYDEYFSEGFSAFSESIVVGAPALLLAAAAWFAGRRGRFLLLGALALIVASTGDALGLRPLLDLVIPGLKLFRYSEKFVGPASLLLCLAAALGAQRALVAARRLPKGLAFVGLTLALGCALLAAACDRAPASWLAFLVEHGKFHRPRIAAAFLSLASSGLWVTAALSAVLALVAILAIVRPSLGGPAAACACLAAGLATTASQLSVAPVSLLRSDFPLAADFVRRAGPSEGRWRVFSLIDTMPTVIGLDDKVGPMAALGQLLSPQLNALARIEGAHEYFSVTDPGYSELWNRAPRTMTRLLGVRFTVIVSAQLWQKEAASLGMFPGPLGSFVRPSVVAPRAFVMHDVIGLAREPMMAAMAHKEFEPERQALVAPEEDPHLPPSPPSPHTEVRWDHPRPEIYSLRTRGDGGLLVVAEHHDPGWGATIDGVAAPVVRVDGVVLGVAVPAGAHTVVLQYRQRGLLPGLACAGLAFSILGGAAAWSVRRGQKVADR